MRNARDIMSEFKSKQNLVSITIREQSNKKPSTNMSRGFNKKNSYNPSNPYEKYKHRLDNGLLDKFNTRDMAYFFRDIANENGVKYVISNITKDMRQFKLCKERGYSNEEILAMIEFLFTSGQEYLSLETIHPGILVSSWCNTIYADTNKWINDEYEPKSKKTKSKREWVGEKDTEDTEIGNWGF